jgi:hypothetical protein
LEFCAVMLFVVVTAALNIAVGYGLALYLGHAPLPRFRRAATAAATIDDAFAPQAEFAAPEPTALSSDAAPAPGRGPIAAAAPTASASATASGNAPAPAPGGDSAELEHEVLAGIEEFRNQLAQMKGQPAAAAETADAPALEAAPA